MREQKIREAQGEAEAIHLVQQALALQTTGNLHAALAPLARALRLAEPEGYVRVFVDEGADTDRIGRAVVRSAQEVGAALR